MQIDNGVDIENRIFNFLKFTISVIIWTKIVKLDSPFRIALEFYKFKLAKGLKHPYKTLVFLANNF